MTMYATLQMDREIDPNRHYIGIGGFEFCFRNGVNIGFDFNSSIANVQRDPTAIKFECDDLVIWIAIHFPKPRFWECCFRIPRWIV